VMTSRSCHAAVWNRIRLQDIGRVSGLVILAEQTIPPIATYFSVVCLFVCRLSHSCTLHKPLDRCVIQQQNCGVQWHTVSDGVLDSYGKRPKPQPKHATANCIAAVTVLCCQMANTPAGWETLFYRYWLVCCENGCR